MDIRLSNVQPIGMGRDRRMRTGSFGALAAMVLVLPAVPAHAQDTPLIDFNGALDHARNTGRMIRQAQQREHRATGAGRPTQGQAAACAGKKTYGRQFGADHPKVRKLYRLCRQFGL